MPIFQCFFTPDPPVYIAVYFIINQTFKIVFISDSFIDTLFMFSHPAPYLICYADIERSVASIGHEINVIHFVLALDAGSSPA